MIVTLADIENNNVQLINVSGTQAELSPTRLGRTRRTVFYVCPITAGVTVTLVPTDGTAVVNTGFVLAANQPFIEVLSDEFVPYQGQWKVVASGAGQVAFVERVENA